MDGVKISLRAARANLGLTLDEVAKQIHVTKQTIINWEHGKTEPPINKARQMCELYRVPLEQIIFCPNG